MLKTIFTYSFAILALLITGCTKESISNDSYDLVGTWEVTGIRSDQANDWNGDGYTETDIYGNYDYCQREILLRFDENGSGQTRQGCNASWQYLSWSLTNSNSRLNIQLPSDDLNMNLRRFTSNTIEGEDQVYANGRTYRITYTFSRR